MLSELLEGKEIGGISFKSLEAIPDAIRKRAIEIGETYLKEEMDHLTLSLYKSFLRTESRETYQIPYFRKRKRLSHLVIAECVEKKGRFLDRIEDELWSLFSEPGWVIPAHNSYIRNTPQLPLPETGRPVLDLFAMETSEIVAVSYALLKDKLTPSLLRTIEAELDRRIVKPFLKDWFWWMGGDSEKLNNWTVWCSQNMLITALILPIEREEKKAIVKKAAMSIDYWYEGYGEDGCCDEGAGYWHSAPLAFFDCIYLLNEATDGALSSVYSLDKVKNMAAYIMNVHVAEDRYINFADCSPCAGTLGAREYLFGKATGNDAIVRQAVIDYRNRLDSPDETCTERVDDNYNLWYLYIECIYGKEILSHPIAEDVELPRFVDYRSVGLSIYREDGVVLAVKSGCNDDSHNHNDTGSITLYSKVHPLLVDIGVETYTKKTFSSERYTIFTMQSQYHNLVNFGSVGQEAGPEYRAENVIATDSGVSMSLEKAYPEGTVASYKRTVAFEGKKIRVLDETVGGTLPILSLITMDYPESKDNKLTFSGWEIAFTGAKGISVEVIPINDKRLRLAWPDKLYRVLIEMEDTLEWTVTIT